MKILVVEDEDSLRRVLQVRLESHRYDVVLAASGEQALGLLEKSEFGLVLSDLRMPGISGLELLKSIRVHDPQLPVIIMTAFGTVENAVEAMQAGAHSYITKPVRIDELLLVMERALERGQLLQQVTNLRQALNDRFGFDNIIGRSGSLLAVLDMAARAARSSSTVLIEGESGTGKELLARAVHVNSPRNGKPFIAVNCGAIPKDLIESELFGYKKGAFTGATTNKMGRIEAADSGTLFLDEIGEMPMPLQVKLLRLIQESEIQKLGSVEAHRVDVRIVAATNKQLLRMVGEGEFREDLYYRLAVIPMTLPPLRQRTEDIPELVRHFWKRALTKQGRPDLVLPDALLVHFTRYHWPGNIRELENVIERISILSQGPTVQLADLPEFLRRERPVLDAIQLELPPTPISLDAVERELIVRALERFDGNQTKAAEYLDLTRKTLIYRMERHGIRREEIGS